jgi:multidrug efflux pump
LEDLSEKYIFETMPVPRAVATLAIPTVVSQIVTMIYNLADLFFIGKLANPAMSAAISLVSPYFNLLTALGNLFGLGGGSLVSRMLGAHEHKNVKFVSAFSLWGVIVATACFSFLTFAFRYPILLFLGSLAENISFAEGYLVWAVVVGGIPTAASLSLAHLLRSEGFARQASLGMMFGGILNVLLDPIFIFALHLEVRGAAIATALSNCFSLAFYLFSYHRLRGRTFVSLLPKYFSLQFYRQIFSVGAASAASTVLGNVAIMIMMNLTSFYGTVAEAAYGIVKRVDQFPLNVSMGLCQGFMPLVGYNYASQNYRRMRKVISFSWKTSAVISLSFVLLYVTFAAPIVHTFLPDEETCRLGAQFLLIACTSIPLTALNFLTSYTLQAMGKGKQSATITVCRQGFLYIPAMYLLNHLFGISGLIWSQPVIEAVMLPISFCIYFSTIHRLQKKSPISQ